jgi:hypothetical protein
MIGPHQGRELELMLAGKKNLAIFGDALVDGVEISEEIIPEKAFAPYVKNGTIKRFSEIVIPKKEPVVPILYVLFTLPGQEWRVQALLWLKKECIAGRRPFDEAYEYFVGRLLDYEEADIKDFIKNACHHLK